MTIEKLPVRIVATILGATIFIVLFNILLPESLTQYALLFFSYIYTFVKEYKIQIVFITINSLGAAMVLYDPYISVPMRISFILVGVVIAFIVNKSFYDKFNKEEEFAWE